MFVTSQLPIQTTNIFRCFFDAHLCPPSFWKRFFHHSSEDVIARNVRILYSTFAVDSASSTAILAFKRVSLATYVVFCKSILQVNGKPVPLLYASCYESLQQHQCLDSVVLVIVDERINNCTYLTSSHFKYGTLDVL